MNDVDDKKHSCWMFTGQGSQWAGMATPLLSLSDLTRQRIELAETFFESYRGSSLIAAINGDAVDQTAITQPALYAVECALVDYWRQELGDPCAVIGHSVGEYAAAYAAGVFRFEDGLKLIEARGRLMQALPSGGKMLAVKASEGDVLGVLNELQGNSVSSSDIDLAIAAVNSPKQTVLSGAGPLVDDAARVLKEAGFRSRALNVSHAFHSPLMAPMTDAFSAVAHDIELKVPRLPFYSSLTADLVDTEIARPEYWIKHVSEAVLFCAALSRLHADLKPDAYLELGPSPILSGLAKRCLEINEGSNEMPLPQIVSSMSKKIELDESLAAAKTAICS